MWNPLGQVTWRAGWLAMECNANRFEQLVAGKRLAQEPHAARPACRIFQRPVVTGSDENNGNLRMRGAQARLHFETGKSGQMHVENRARRAPHVERRQKLLTGAEGFDLVVSQAQQPSQGNADGRLIIDNSNTMLTMGHMSKVNAMDND